MGGFYLLGYGAFYQTFLEAYRQLLSHFQVSHGAAAVEAELVQGPWTAAMAEHKVATDLISPGSATSPTWMNSNVFRSGNVGSMLSPATPSAPSRRRPLERQLASRFAIRFIPNHFDFRGFEDAARQVKLVGMARLAGGHVELELRRTAGGSPAKSREQQSPGSTAASTAQTPGMLWLCARQRVAQGFEHRFSFQVHAPVTSGVTAPSEYGCRFALCFQQRWSPSAIQTRSYLPSGLASVATSFASPSGRSQVRSPGQVRSDSQSGVQAPNIPVWTVLEECLALEITYCVQPSQGTGPQANVTLALYVCHPGLGDGRRQLGNSATPVDCLAQTSSQVAAPRGMVHLVRFFYDVEKHQMQVYFGADAVSPAWTAEVDLAALLALDLGCAYLGVCLLPIDHRHNVIEHSNAAQPTVSSQKFARDRPLSIVTWHHLSKTYTETSGKDGRPGQRGDELDQASWFKHMELSYEVPWPLPLVITQHYLDQYNRLFRLLLAFRHAHQELQCIDLPKEKRTAWALRAQLSFFITQILIYFQQDVIEVAHQRLLQAIEASKGFDEVVAAHESFLATATSNCFLKARELHEGLETILQIALSFCTLPSHTATEADVAHDGKASGWVAAQATRRAVEARLVHDRELNKLHMNFTFAVRSVLKMMASMHRRGMHTHLSQLLLRLDYNGYFSGETE